VGYCVPLCVLGGGGGGGRGGGFQGVGESDRIVSWLKSVEGISREKNFLIRNKKRWEGERPLRERDTVVTSST